MPISFKPSVPPGEYRAALRGLRSVEDLARLLDVTPKQLATYTYGRGRQYRTSEVQKRRGGVRTISRPSSGLKILQQKLAELLQSAYRPRTCVHGFVPGRSIATNAQAHSDRRWVFNVDLRDFFPSINFGRVRGRLMARPFSLPANVATVCAQLCCFENELPQGAPSSPLLSNIVCSGMDARLERLAKRYGCSFTRYADDLTFSCDAPVFPAEIGYQVSGSGSEATVGEALTSVINDSGFEVHDEKIRLQRFDSRQVVTGLTVNRFPNVSRKRIRRVRAMLRAWQVFGHDAAESHFFERYDNKHRPLGTPRFAQVVKGHIDFIGMVRGNSDTIYNELLEEFASLPEGYRPRPRSKRPRDHLPTFEDALWLVEWEWGQGTAFELDGIGLVTCSHVFRGTDGSGHLVETRTAEVWQPRAPDLRYEAKLNRSDYHRDLAILEFAGSSGRPLPVGPTSQLPVGSEVWAAGYPNHGPGSGLWRDEGRITRHDHHIRSPRFTVGFPIIQGASGCPVLDAKERVVGIASMGAESFEAAARSNAIRFGVIPIGVLTQWLDA